MLSAENKVSCLKHNIVLTRPLEHESSTRVLPTKFIYYKVRKRANIRNRYNQAPHLTQDTNRKVTNSQLDTTNESQEVGPFPADGHKVPINR